MTYFKICVALFFSAFLFLTSCHYEEEAMSEDVLISLYGKTLTMKELEKMIPDDISEKDSIEMAKKHMQKWMNETLLYRSAIENLKDSSNIKEKVRDFRKQMYIYEYESQYVESELDTIVTREEVKAYYENNLQSYALDRKAVKAHYMIMDAEIPAYYRELDKVRRATPERMDILYDAIKGTNKTIVEHNDKWMYMDDLLKEIHAVDNRDVRQKALQLGYFAVEDSTKRYIVKINEKIMPGDTMPVDLIESKISHIIVNKRKQELITNLKNQLIQDAKSSDAIVINEN
ncbi:MAG: hypothetical protein PF590_00260 [Candidatus Delongbacteria bacterium]|jgi:hypothetical protein|nr:hypothetical protein [Candidatus Delongbacteria bacterium]